MAGRLIKSPLLYRGTRKNHRKEGHGNMKDELLLEVKAPEILCDMGLKAEAKDMIRAHNEILSAKAGALPGARSGLLTTPEQEARREQYKKEQLKSSFFNTSYREKARRFLEKVLPKAKQGIVKYDKAVKDAQDRYNTVSRELEQCRKDLEACRQARKDYCRELDTAVIKPFIYANSGGKAFSDYYGKRIAPLYPHLDFYTSSHENEPIDHIEYMLSYIDTLNGNRPADDPAPGKV